VVEGARLESVYTGNCIEGSNPSVSASKLIACNLSLSSGIITVEKLVLLNLKKLFMPTTANKNKTTTSGTKNSGNKNSKSSGRGLLNVVPTAKARDRAKDIDFKRRGDAESNEL
jgi:hypothetical protein